VERATVYSPIVGYTAIGLGAVGLAVGTVFGLKVSRQNDVIDSICPTVQPCHPPDTARYNTAVDEAKGARTVSLIGFGVGAALVATGAILVFTAPRASSNVGFRPSLRVGGTQLVFDGTW